MNGSAGKRKGNLPRCQPSDFRNLADESKAKMRESSTQLFRLTDNDTETSGIGQGYSVLRGIEPNPIDNIRHPKNSGEAEFPLDLVCGRGGMVC
jgi:hypothetical protein